MSDRDASGLDSAGFDTRVFREPEGEDEKLVAELRYAGRLDPVPAEAIAAARSSLAWRTIDAELAELAYDSLFDDKAMAGLRTVDAPPRIITFESPALTVEVEAAASGTRRRLIGQLVPPQRARLDVRHAGGVISVDADELGRFAVSDLPPGPVSLHVRGEGDAAVAVTTDWIVV
jgi:hypothetical protein